MHPNKLNAQIFFVDNNVQEILSQWQGSNLSGNHTMIDFEPFTSIERTVQLIVESNATIVVLGYYLNDNTTGLDVIKALNAITYPAVFISNTGGDAYKLFPNGTNHANREEYGLYSAVESSKSNNFEYLGNEQNLNDFRECLVTKQYSKALMLMRRVKGLKLEHYVSAALDPETVINSPQTVRQVISYFVDQREDLCPSHGYWVHSVSHFFTTLWKLNLKSELQYLLKIAIAGANELSDENCSARLIYDFFQYSEFSDRPIDFGITFESIKFFRTLSEYQKQRIEKVAFKNEEEYLLFKLQFADCPDVIYFDSHYQLALVDKEKVALIVARLNEISSNQVSLEIILRLLYQKQCENLQNLLAATTHEATVKKLTIALEMTQSLL